MKNVVLLVCSLMLHMTTHCMELEKQDELSVDYKEKEQVLVDDCKGQLKNCLEKYEASDDFTPQDMEKILGVLSYITNGSEHSIDYIHQTKDKELNGFFQHALKKIDLPMMQWLIAKGNIKYHSERECSDFIAFCTESLSPAVEEIRRNRAYDILKSVIEHYKTEAVFQACKDFYLRIMIMLQLKHRAADTKFIIEEELLTPFVQQNQSHSVSGLSDMCQTIVDVDDKDSNTLAHIIVEQHDADELHILMNKNYISKTVKNSAAKTVHDLAFDKFRAFTQNTSSASVFPEKAKAARCCYYMLDKYFAENDFDKKKNCCDQHPVLKRYGVDLLKQSPSTSASASISSSISSSESSSESSRSLENIVPAPLEISLSKDAANVAPVLADEPDEANCCIKLWNHLITHNKVIKF